MPCESVTVMPPGERLSQIHRQDVDFLPKPEMCRFRPCRLRRGFLRMAGLAYAIFFAPGRADGAACPGDGYSRCSLGSAGEQAAKQLRFAACSLFFPNICLQKII